MSVVYNKSFHVGGDLSRPLTTEGNERVLNEILEHPIEFRVCYYRTEKFRELRKEFQERFPKYDEELKSAFAFSVKCWFQSLREAMRLHRIGKENFRYGVSFTEIQKFVYQFG